MKKLLESSESEIQTSILDYLNRNGIFSWRVNTVGIYDPVKKIYRKPSKFTLKGVGDICGVLPDGRILTIEVKNSKGKVSMEQQAFINKINKLNGKAFVARSLQDVIDELRIFL